MSADEVLHLYRYATSTCESQRPAFYEVFTTFDNPYPKSEFVKCSPAELEPSVTEELVPVDVHVWVDFFAQVEEGRVADAKRLAEAAGAADGLVLPTVGRLIAPFRAHPVGSIVLCPRIVAGETMTVVEWP
ncbi:MAG: hypothetical protein U0174_16650 [Polyangiaceae bacterium]